MSGIALGSAVVGVAGSVYSSKQASKGGSKSSEPKYLQDAEKGAIDRANTIADRPYSAFEGERVAGLSGNEQTASNLARYGSDESRAMYGKAGASLDSMEDYNSSNLAKYINPYTDAVLQPQLREQNTAYESGRSRLLNSKAGALGGDRAAITASQLDKTHRQAVADVTGKTYSDAFQNASQTFFQDQNRKIAASDAYQRVGGNLSELNRTQTQDLMATGGLSRMIEQGELDANYGQFIEKRDWDVNNLDPLLKTISASKGGNITTTNTGGTPGAWGQALGAASTIAGAYFAAKKEPAAQPAQPVQSPNPGGNGSGRSLGL